MQYINLEDLISVEDLKANPTAILKLVDQKGQIVIIENNRPAFVISKYVSLANDKSRLAKGNLSHASKSNEATRIVHGEQPEEQIAAKELALNNTDTENALDLSKFTTNKRGILLIDEIDTPVYALPFLKKKIECEKSLPTIRYIIINKKRFYFTMDFDPAIGKFGNDNSARNSRLLNEKVLSPDEFVIVTDRKFKKANFPNHPEVKFGTDLWLKNRIELEVSILEHGYGKRGLCSTPDESGWNKELKFFYDIASTSSNSERFYRQKI